MVQCPCGRVQVRVRGLQSGKQVREEAGEVIVLWLEREPGSRVADEDSQSASKVDLPNPAGAERRISIRSPPSYNLWSR